jgi:hypothetical protein
MSKADEIAARGVKRVQMGDREHEYFSPAMLDAQTKQSAADALDDEFGGFFNVEMKNPE